MAEEICLEPIVARTEPVCSSPSLMARSYLLFPCSYYSVFRLENPLIGVRFSVAERQFMAEVEGWNMEQALSFAISLTGQRDEQHLSHWWLSTLYASYQPKGILLGMLDVDGRQLACSGWVKGEEVSLVVAVDDFSNPLAYVLHQAKSRTWDFLHGGARIENADLRAQLAKLWAAVWSARFSS